MALTTYSELQASVASWLNRTDMTSQIPDFITLAEKRMARLFELRMNETEASLTTVQGSRYVALPSDYHLPIALYLCVWNPRSEIGFMPVEQIQYANISGYPMYWGIDGSNIAFNLNAGGNYPLVFRYRTAVFLSTSNTTNWVLTNHPDVYLYGALSQAAIYLPGEERLQQFAAIFEQAISDIMTHETQHTSLSILRTDIPIRNRNNTAANFYSGV